MKKGIKLQWLNDSFHYDSGVTWGVPWQRGILSPTDSLRLYDERGNQSPLQSWPMAYWPDGSVKWTAQAASFCGDVAQVYYLEKGANIQPLIPLTVTTRPDEITVNTGKMVCKIGRSGSTLIRGVSLAGREVCNGGKLIAIREVRDLTSGSRRRTEEDLEGFISEATVEQAGPVRAIIYLKGRHRSPQGAGPWLPKRQWLSFDIRFYFYSGQENIKGAYTFFYDGNPQQDYIKGLGIAFAVPMSGPLYNRHLRLAGDSGFFSDAPKSLCTWRSFGNNYETLYRSQYEGELIDFDPAMDGDFLKLLDDSAVWNDFKLAQDTAGSYRIEKRTKAGCGWVKALNGHSSGGLAYLGGETGGISVGLRNFWEKYPTALEIDGMAGPEAWLTLWFWSPEGKAMDLRHYDTETHVESAYEGFHEMRSTPMGIANTSEFTIWCHPSTPKFSMLQAMVKACQEPALLICEPRYYHDTQVMGIWGLEDRSTPLQAWLERCNDRAIAFWESEIRQRQWYGFWDYGDIMRFYDPVRHSWRYDLGGCAWNNSEIVPNLWLWYAFLRSGRGDIFRLAEAMTRHTSEVDQYHFGEYAGLGSRHNVVHWGCGCKEARVSMAGLHRCYYYLTADERIGDILNEVKDADEVTLRLDPLRALVPRDEYPTHARSGPDWAAFISNWMTRWERFEEQDYRHKILAGIESLKDMPHQLCSGPIFGYDPKSGKLFGMGENNSSFHMINCFGALQVWMELATLLQDPVWERMLADYGAFYLLNLVEKQQLRPDIPDHKNWGMPESVLAIAAFSAAYREDEKLAQEVWRRLIADLGGYPDGGIAPIIQDGPNCPYPVMEEPKISSGIGLSLMAMFVAKELIARWMPE